MKLIKKTYVILVSLSLATWSSTIPAMHNQESHSEPRLILTPEPSPCQVLCCLNLFDESNSNQNSQTPPLVKKKSKKAVIATEDVSIHITGEGIDIAEAAPVRATSVIHAQIIGMYIEENQHAPHAPQRNNISQSFQRISDRIRSRRL